MLSRRIRIIIAYDGTDFVGWQVQPGLPTIQATLEEIVSGIEGSPVHVVASGRTDAGVHALAQVAAFTLTNRIPCENLQRAINRLLPPSIRILETAEASADFQPRFDALAKTYRYRMYREEICPPFEWRYSHHHPWPLDEAKMLACAPVFEGSHDFRAYAASDPRYADGRSTVRTIFSSTLIREGPSLVYTVRGSGFLKHMVRNIAGTLIHVGRGNISCAVLPEKCGPTAPAKGLTLLGVEYPPHVNLKR